MTNDQNPTIKQAIDKIAAAAEPTHTGWLFRHRIERAERAAVLRNVLLDSDPRWFVPFVVMLALSAGIATLGLSQDSAAAVIGAMVVAPLGAPIAALGGAIALAWPRESLKMLLIALVGAAFVILLGFLIGLFLPTATPTGQILARTNPDLRDLGVALFAGAAGAYAQTRGGLVSTLTGVAIAVALVPPLAAVGLMLEEHRYALAQGAGVLFTANLVGIVLATVAVLLITRYAPLPRLRHARWKSITLLASATVIAVLVAIPLTTKYLSLIDSAGATTAVHQQVVATLGPLSGAVVKDIDVQGTDVTIELRGGTTIPTSADFEKELGDELGPDVTVTIVRD